MEDTETWTMEITKRFNRDIGLTPQETLTHTLLVPINTGVSYMTGKRKFKPYIHTAYPFYKELSDHVSKLFKHQKLYYQQNVIISS